MEGKKVNRYSVTLMVMGAVALLLLLCQTVEGLSDGQFLAALVGTKFVGASLVWLLVHLALRWDREGKITLNALNNDTELR